MRSAYGRQRAGWVVVASAAALAAAGGSAVGLGTPAWLAGAVGGFSALVAAVVVDRVFHRRDDLAAARQRRSEVLDALTVAVPGDEDDALGLLRADRCPVPYRGRRRELRRLADWRADETACPVFMIAGSAGVGKSRLALEFATGLPEGWVAGWLHAESGGQAVSAIRDCGDPAVILVDDADGRNDVPMLLNDLARQPSNPAIRVVLLTRSSAALAASLTSALEERHEWIAARAPGLGLHEEGSQEDRERWFGEAATAFATALNRAVPDLSLWSRAARAQADQPMLALQAHALLAVLSAPAGQGDPRSLAFSEIAEALMKHEKRRWRAVVASWAWGSGGAPSPILQERCVAALALLGAVDDGEAARVLRRIPQLQDASAERLSAVASWVLALYPPGPGGAPRIQPDMIGEWFVVSQLNAQPALARALRDDLTDDQADSALTFLAHAVDRIESAGSLFGEFAAGDLRRQVLAAAKAALTGETGRYLLDSVIAEQIRSADGWTLDQLSSLSGLIPGQLLLLTHVVLADLAVTLYRHLAKDNPAAHQAGLAAALSSLGVGLDRAGAYQDALAVVEESVTLWRALAKDNPPAHQAGLAAALTNLGVGLDRAARYQDALAVAEESVTLERALAADNPVAHQAGLAMALNSLGIRLGRVGRYQDALAATEASVTLERALAADNPAAHQAGLAMALNNLGTDLDRVGRYQDALAVAEESVTLRRALAAANPAAHQVDLAIALINLGSYLDRVGRYPDTLAATEESVTVYRALVADNPAAHQAGLAIALNNLGADLDRVGRYPDALAAAEESVTLRRALVADNPAAHQAGLAIALNSLGIRLDQVGRYHDALAAAEESVTLRRALAADNPAAHQEDLALALNNLGAFLDRAARHQDALAARTEIADVYRNLASANPELYLDKYRQVVSALRREYDQRGLHNAAILHHLADPLPPSSPR